MSLVYAVTLDVRVLLLDHICAKMLLCDGEALARAHGAESPYLVPTDK